MRRQLPRELFGGDTLNCPGRESGLLLAGKINDQGS